MNEGIIAQIKNLENHDRVLVLFLISAIKKHGPIYLDDIDVSYADKYGIVDGSLVIMRDDLNRRNMMTLQIDVVTAVGKR